ncbi:class I SAM-dependent methyltransferase [Pelagibacterium sediminicola]|uniref:class I SAM-dependent methyltransferase n=1 Tax=Pelagibacterium sediminicola TaxID=2248761 RepID=UPI000E321004|nr:50S ribosomal protein L11 methyltransferase [Pelagibacterium sediminicola]
MARDAAAYIKKHLPVRAVPHLDHIRLHLAVPQSGVWRLARNDIPPYWAWTWPGGLALARHLAANPGLVAGRVILDLGAGSGLVAIGAALCGASRIIACDTDPTALVAASLNAELNNVSIETLNADLLAGPPPEVQTILVGDLFYDAGLARAVLLFLVRCREAGIDVLIGDIGRADLPREDLVELAAYPVSEFGEGAGERMAGVFGLG